MLPMMPSQPTSVKARFPLIGCPDVPVTEELAERAGAGTASGDPRAGRRGGRQTRFLIRDVDGATSLAGECACPELARAGESRCSMMIR